MSEKILIDPNTADENTLTQIPGVGAELAKRIIEARPYDSLEDLNRVNGIGPTFLEKLAHYIALSPAEVETVGGDEVSAVEEAISAEPEHTSEAEMLLADTHAPSDLEDSHPESESQPEAEPMISEMEPLDADVSSIEESPASDSGVADQSAPPAGVVTVSDDRPPTAAAPPAYATRGQAFLMSFGCSTLALILALVIGIGLLAGLNNGNLIFATPFQVSNLALEVERIDKDVQGIEQDLAGLQSRVDNLEGLSSRVEAVEQTAEDLELQVSAITSQVESIDQRVLALVTDVEALQAESTRYQEFFNGLKDLLSKLFTAEEGSDEQQPK